MQNTLIAVLVAFCLVLGVGLWVAVQPEKEYEMEFYVGFDELVDENWLGLDEFFFTDAVYRRLFTPLGLVDKMPVELKAKILGQIMNNLALDKPVVFKVVNFQGDDTLFVFFELRKNDEGEMFIVQGSNYNFATNKLAKRNREYENTLAGFYFVKGEKIIDGYYMANPEELEKRIRESENLNDLADFYLMDDNPENDQYIVELLQQYQTEAEELSSRFVSYLTLAEYYASCGEYALSRITLSDAELILQDSIELRVSKWAEDFKMVQEICEIGRMLREGQAE